MNTLSIKKVQDLLHQNSHRILDVYIHKDHVRYLLILCEKYRHFFILDLKSLPIIYIENDEKFKEFKVHNIHHTELPYIDINSFSNLYENGIQYDSNIKKEFDSNYIINHYQIQKKRLDLLFKNDYLHFIFFIKTFIIDINSNFQFENIQTNENFFLFSVYLDDYYIHQHTISNNLYKHSEYIFEYIFSNIKSQYNYIQLNLKNTKKINDYYLTLNLKISKYQKQFHIISSLFQKVYDNPLLYTKKRQIIDVLYLIYRNQHEFILEQEELFFQIFYHLNMMLKKMN
jgi:hypothetical protein